MTLVRRLVLKFLVNRDVFDLQVRNVPVVTGPIPLGPQRQAKDSRYVRPVHTVSCLISPKRVPVHRLVFHDSCAWTPSKFWLLIGWRQQEPEMVSNPKRTS